jgi:hypothetical protein
MPLKRPPIHSITFISAEGNPYERIVGRNGITQIKETEENGEYCLIAWVEVWQGDDLLSRHPQNKLEHIIYEMSHGGM